MKKIIYMTIRSLLYLIPLVYLFFREIKQGGDEIILSLIICISIGIIITQKLYESHGYWRGYEKGFKIAQKRNEEAIRALKSEIITLRAQKKQQ